MSTTCELRRMLDECGVEWEADDTQVDGNGTMYRVTYISYFECSECHIYFYISDKSVNYCPNCGAKVVE